MSEPSLRASILVVDDTPANLAVMSELLRDEYRVRVATSGERALQMVASEAPPDLILLDVMMPGMTGYEVCRQLKADPSTRHIPIIFCSALNEVDDEMRGLALGGVDYIAKPVNPPIVKARVRTHLLLSEQSRSLERAVQQLREQAAELEEWNRTLTQRVEQQVAEVNRLGRLTRFFSPSVAELILSGGDDPLRHRRREIVVVFLDLRGFTAFTETADPEEVMGVLGEYHAEMGRLIMGHDGTLERFAGDGMMVFFNDPVSIDNPAAAAVRMALEMQHRFVDLCRRWRSRGYALEMGIGIAQGFATIGAIGFEGRRDYGAIGNVTNLAARLCSEAQGGQVLVSQRVLGHIDGWVSAQPVGELSLKGFARPVSVFSVAGVMKAPTPDAAA
jgi:class 3 adenylate cyclase